MIGLDDQLSQILLICQMFFRRLAPGMAPWHQPYPWRRYFWKVLLVAHQNDR